MDSLELGWSENMSALTATLKRVCVSKCVCVCVWVCSRENALKHWHKGQRIALTSHKKSTLDVLTVERLTNLLFCCCFWGTADREGEESWAKGGASIDWVPKRSVGRRTDHCWLRARETRACHRPVFPAVSYRCWTWGLINGIYTNSHVHKQTQTQTLSFPLSLARSLLTSLSYTHWE